MHPSQVWDIINSFKTKNIVLEWKGKNIGLLCLYKLYYYYYKTTHAHCNKYKQYKGKSKSSLLWFVFSPLVLLVRVPSVQFCILSAFCLPGLLWNCPVLRYSFMLATSPLSHKPYLLSIYFCCHASDLLLGLHLVLKIGAFARATLFSIRPFPTSPSEILFIFGAQLKSSLCQ